MLESDRSDVASTSSKGSLSSITESSCLLVSGSYFVGNAQRIQDYAEKHFHDNESRLIDPGMFDNLRKQDDQERLNAQDRLGKKCIAIQHDIKSWSKQEYKRRVVGAAKEHGLSQLSGFTTLTTADQIGPAFKSYAKSAIESDHSTTTLQRIVEVGCGIFWGPQWDGSYIRHAQKHIESKYNIATDLRVITNLGRQAIKDLSKKVSYILWTICHIKVYQNNSAMCGANSIIDKPSGVPYRLEAEGSASVNYCGGNNSKVVYWSFYKRCDSNPDQREMMNRPSNLLDLKKSGVTETELLKMYKELDASILHFAPTAMVQLSPIVSKKAPFSFAIVH